MFGGGGGGGKAVNPPKPIQIDINKMANDMLAGDTAAYNAGDAYMSQFYPDLTQGRNLAIEQAYQGVTGPPPPELENAFVNNANMGAASSLGGGDQSFGLGTGSLARRSAAASVASQGQNFEDYNRSVMENENAMYAPRSFGMTPEDAANFFTFNNTQMNNYLQQKFAAETQAYYQNQASGQAAGASTIGLITSILGAAATAY